MVVLYDLVECIMIDIVFIEVMMVVNVVVKGVFCIVKVYFVQIFKVDSMGKICECFFVFGWSM